MFDLTIIIPCYNKYNFTSACLTDLFNLPDNHQIIVVDNGSTDQTKEIANLHKNNLLYIRNDQNEGFAKACNLGFQSAQGRSVMFLNNDVRVKSNHSDWTKDLLNLSDHQLAGPTMGLLNQNFDFIKECEKIEGKYWYMSGWNLTGTRKTFQDLTLPGDLGPFSTEFFAYFEDTDLSFRARELEFQFLIKPVPVVHFGRVTSTTVGLSTLYPVSKRKFQEKWKNRILNNKAFV